MPGFNPANHIVGPAIVVHNSHAWYFEDDITVRAVLATWQPKTSMFGKIDERLRSRHYEISGTPVGACVSAYLTKSFPYTFAMIGASIFGADKDLVIWTKAGIKHTYQRCAITKMPTISLSTGKQAFGPITFSALLKTATEFDTTGAFLSLSTAAFADASFDETKLTSPGYTATFGAIFSAVDSVDGFTIEYAMETTPVNVDRFGLIDMKLDSLVATAKFMPAGMSEAAYLTVVGDGAATVKPGESLGKAGEDLVISGPVGGLSVTLTNAGVKDHGWAFGSAPRIGELGFMSRVSFVGGAAVDPLIVAVV